MWFIKLKIYSTWFLVNFGICSIPIVLAIFIGQEKNQIFSGFISFSFTILVSSLYLFDNYIYMKDEKSLPEFLRYSTFGWVILLIVLFALYPKYPSYDSYKVLNENLFTISVGVLFITTLISFLLNKASIEGKVEKRKGELKIKGSDKVKNDVQKIEDELKLENKK